MQEWIEGWGIFLHILEAHLSCFWCWRISFHDRNFTWLVKSLEYWGAQGHFENRLCFIKNLRTINNFSNSVMVIELRVRGCADYCPNKSQLCRAQIKIEYHVSMYFNWNRRAVKGKKDSLGPSDFSLIYVVLELFYKNLTEGCLALNLLGLAVYLYKLLYSSNLEVLLLKLLLLQSNLNAAKEKIAVLFLLQKYSSLHTWLPTATGNYCPNCKYLAPFYLT